MSRLNKMVLILIRTISFIPNVTISYLLPVGRWKILSSDKEWRIDQTDQLEATALIIRWQQPIFLVLTLKENLNDSNLDSLRKFLRAANIHYTGKLSLYLERSHDGYQAVPEDVLLQIERGR